MLSDVLEAMGVRGFAAVPLAGIPVRMPRFLEGKSYASVVVMTVPYRTGRDTGNLAAFAAAKDYHRFFRTLEAAAREDLLPRHPGASLDVFADNSPFDEGLLAAEAGLGVRGDNGLLLTERYGSYVFVGEMVTDLSLGDLEREGIPVRERAAEIPECPHCGACAAACPGGCLPGNDRSTCVSALSQKKGDLTPTEKEILDKSPYVWGCDVCQTVCPYNIGAETCPEGWFTEDLLDGMDRETLDGMDREAYRGRAFGWRPRRLMERNLEGKETPHG